MSENDATKLIIEDYRVKVKIVASLYEDSLGIFYDCNMF